MRIFFWPWYHNNNNNNFLARIQKALTIKEKIDKMDFIKMKNVWSSQNTIQRIVRQVPEWEKVFIIYLFNRGLVYRMCKKNSCKAMRKKQTAHYENKQDTWLGTSQKRYPNANVHLKRGLMEIKTTLRYRYTAIRRFFFLSYLYQVLGGFRVTRNS